MSVSRSSGLKTEAFDVEGLVTDAWNGHIRVPHFQRDFRWSWEDVQRLFDSIVKGYPIGNLLLWKRSGRPQTLRLGALTIEGGAETEAYWVVDGQQRLTALANALHPDGADDPRFAISCNIVTERFVRPPRVHDPLIVPLPVIFNLESLVEWFANAPDVGDKLRPATSIARRIRQFEVPAYLVQQDDMTVLQDIFDRMNNYGRRLTRAEVFAALNAVDEDGSESATTFDTIASSIEDDMQFGRIDDDTVLAAILARRGPEVRRDIRTEFETPNDEGRDAAYEEGGRSLRNAVAFLQRDLGVPHISMLAYRYLLVVLSRFFALNPSPSSRNRRLLKRWYWRAALAGPSQFKGGTPNAARILCGKVTTNESESIGALLAQAETDERTVDLQRFSTNEAATKIALCALWSAGPRSPGTAEEYTLADLAENLEGAATARNAVRNIVPRGQISEPIRGWAANRIVAPDVEIEPTDMGRLFTREPLTADPGDFDRVLRSHLMDREMSAILASGDVDQFLRLRQQKLKEHVEMFLARMAEWDFEDTPPLAELELADEAYGD